MSTREGFEYLRFQSVQRRLQLTAEADRSEADLPRLRVVAAQAQDALDALLAAGPVAATRSGEHSMDPVAVARRRRREFDHAVAAATEARETAAGRVREGEARAGELRVRAEAAQAELEQRVSALHHQCARELNLYFTSVVRAARRRHPDAYTWAGPAAPWPDWAGPPPRDAAPPAAARPAATGSEFVTVAGLRDRS